MGGRGGVGRDRGEGGRRPYLSCVPLRYCCSFQLPAGEVAGGIGGGERGARSLLELCAFEVLLQLEAGKGLGLAGVLLEMLSVLGLLALPQLERKLQLQGGGQRGQHPGVQLIHIIRQHGLHTTCPFKALCNENIRWHCLLSTCTLGACRSADSIRQHCLHKTCTLAGPCDNENIYQVKLPAHHMHTLRTLCNEGIVR